MTTRSRIPAASPKSAKATMSQAGAGRGAKNSTSVDTQTVLDRLDKIEVSLQTKIDASIQSQEFSAKQLTDKMELIESTTTQVRAKTSKLEEDNIGVKVQLNVHGTRLHELEDKIKQIERKRRRNILIIEGLEEKEGERANIVLDKIFEDLNVGYKADICTAVFRRGKGVSDKENKTGANRTGNNGRNDAEFHRPRPLVVIFPSVAEKAAIFRNLKNLQGKEEWNRVYFNDDLTETQANEQRDVRALAAYAKSVGYNVRVKAGNLVLDGRIFKYHELYKLPRDLTLAKAKTLNILNDKAVVFQSQHSPLSNLFPSNIIYRGQVYLSS